MPSLSFVTEFVYENFANVVSSNGGTHFNFRCPFCGDSEKSKIKKRFHLQYKSENDIYFNCFNCAHKGNFYDLYAFINGISSKEAFKKLNKYNKDQIFKRLSKTSRKQFEEHKTELYIFNQFLKEKCLDEHSEPSSYIQGKLISVLKTFKEKRKISDAFICYEGKFKNRIIIPVYNKKDCIYFQGRRINSSQYPKYLNPKIEKENVILNKDKFDKEKYIIITEGLLDAISIGDQGTSCLGATIKDDFLKKIFEYTDKGIIISLDNDERGIQETINIINKSKYNKSLYYFFLDKYKDLNEFHVNNSINLYKYIIDNKKSYLNAIMHLKLIKGGKMNETVKT
jgi:DNA primase